MPAPPETNNSSVDFVLPGYIHANGLNIRDRIQRVEVRLFARTRIDEIAVSSERLGNVPANAGACAGNENGFLRTGFSCFSKTALR